LPEDPTDDSDIAIIAVLLADGSDFVKSKRWVEPKDLTRKFRLPIVRSISWSKLAKTRVRVGGWGWKSTVLKDIRFPSTFELLLARSEKVVKFMIPTPTVPTVGANWRGLTRQIWQTSGLNACPYR
jgi:hypothetical protein